MYKCNGFCFLAQHIQCTCVQSLLFLLLGDTSCASVLCHLCGLQRYHAGPSPHSCREVETAAQTSVAEHKEAGLCKCVHLCMWVNLHACIVWIIWAKAQEMNRMKKKKASIKAVRVIAFYKYSARMYAFWCVSVLALDLVSSCVKPNLFSGYMYVRVHVR